MGIHREDDPASSTGRTSVAGILGALAPDVSVISDAQALSDYVDASPLADDWYRYPPPTEEQCRWWHERYVMGPNGEFWRNAQREPALPYDDGRRFDGSQGDVISALKASASKARAINDKSNEAVAAATGNSADIADIAAEETVP